MQTWRKELRLWAEQCAARFARRPGVAGAILGGSLARGQEWQHSDMELGLLVDERDSGLPYFNIDSGRGVEVIQLVRPELEEQVRTVEGGDWSPLLQWPIQLWRGLILHDPTGLLGRFKRQFDTGLFRDEVLQRKIADQQAKIARALAEARRLRSDGRPAAALVRVRGAMNDLILAFHWAHGELPRSQNRTDSRLRQVCRRHGASEFYRLYRDVFHLDNANRVIRSLWPGIRQQVLEITGLWGDSARDFFDFAVDSHFQWRQNAGILTVYRLYVPVIGDEERGLIQKLDDPAWRQANPDLLKFLGLEEIQVQETDSLVERIAISAAALGLQTL